MGDNGKEKINEQVGQVGNQKSDETSTNEHENSGTLNAEVTTNLDDSKSNDISEELKNTSSAEEKMETVVDINNDNHNGIEDAPKEPEEHVQQNNSTNVGQEPPDVEPNDKSNDLNPQTDYTTQRLEEEAAEKKMKEDTKNLMKIYGDQLKELKQIIEKGITVESIKELSEKCTVFINENDKKLKLY